MFDVFDIEDSTKSKSVAEMNVKNFNDAKHQRIQDVRLSNCRMRTTYNAAEMATSVSKYIKIEPNGRKQKRRIS